MKIVVFNHRGVAEAEESGERSQANLGGTSHHAASSTTHSNKFVTGMPIYVDTDVYTAFCQAWRSIPSQSNSVCLADFHNYY